MIFESFHSVTGEENFLSKTPYEIGIPLLHIIGARVGMESIYFEFTGDTMEVFEGLEEIPV